MNLYLQINFQHWYISFIVLTALTTLSWSSRCWHKKQGIEGSVKHVTFFFKFLCFWGPDRIGLGFAVEGCGYLGGGGSTKRVWLIKQRKSCLELYKAPRSMTRDPVSDVFLSRLVANILSFNETLNSRPHKQRLFTSERSINPIENDWIHNVRLLWHMR